MRLYIVLDFAPKTGCHARFRFNVVGFVRSFNFSFFVFFTIFLWEFNGLLKKRDCVHIKANVATLANHNCRRLFWAVHLAKQIRAASMHWSRETIAHEPISIDTFLRHKDGFWWDFNLCESSQNIVRVMPIMLMKFLKRGRSTLKI